MPELIGAGVMGLVLGPLIGVTLGYDKGWRDGVDWARREVFGG